MICPQTNEEVSKEYCDSFVVGAGCREKKTCPEYCYGGLPKEAIPEEIDKIVGDDIE